MTQVHDVKAHHLPEIVPSRKFGKYAQHKGLSQVTIARKHREH